MEIAKEVVKPCLDRVGWSVVYGLNASKDDSSLYSFREIRKIDIKSQLRDKNVRKPIEHENQK